MNRTEYQRIVDNATVANPKYFSVKTSRATCQELLLNNDSIFNNGSLYQFKTKHVGAGIYEITLIPKC
jgi:hypothetical protein